MSLSRLRKLVSRVTSRVIPRTRSPFGIDYWENRARALGKRSVLNIRHTEAEFDAVTEQQKREIYPILVRCLSGQEELILDFGCGPGRFTGDLAAMIGGKAIGMDPIENLLQSAPVGNNVEYRVMKPGEIPLPSESVDIIWSCLVLGVISSRRDLVKTIRSMKRVLKPTGLVFLVENTSALPTKGACVFRSVSEYQHLFDFVDLTWQHEYDDMGETISVMAGRKHSVSIR